MYVNEDSVNFITSSFFLFFFFFTRSGQHQQHQHVSAIAPRNQRRLKEIPVSSESKGPCSGVPTETVNSDQLLSTCQQKKVEHKLI